MSSNYVAIRPEFRKCTDYVGVGFAIYATGLCIPYHEMHKKAIYINKIIIHKVKPTSDRVSEPNSCDTQTEEISHETPAMPTLPPSAEAQPQRPIKHELVPISNATEINNRNSTTDCGELYSSPGNEALITIDPSTPMNNSLSTYHELQLVKQQLEQQKQQTQVAASQVRLLRDQLQAESAARIESQARTHQLLIANNDLLEHIQNLVKQLQEFELKVGQQNRDPEKTSSNKDTVSISSQPIQIYCDAATPSSTGLMLSADLHELESSHQLDHLAGMYENRNNINMLGVNTSAKTPKSSDTVSVSSLSSCAFSRSPSFRMSASPNVMNEEAHHLIPNMLPASNQNYLRVNSIPVNSVSSSMNQSGLAENHRNHNSLGNDISRNHLQMPGDQSTNATKQNYLQSPNVVSSSFMQAVPFKQKVSRHSSSDDTYFLHQNSNELDSINKYLPNMPTSRTVPTMNSAFLENVTADIGRSYGRQYSLNLQNQQQNITSNFADLSVNESHDSPKISYLPGIKFQEC
ncbi:Dystrophin-like protein 1 [Nymphon striatum]|nr:Dystrophin-like protein 1 [Nymphon striatum]